MNLYCNVFKLEGIECLRPVHVRKLTLSILFLIASKDSTLSRFDKRSLTVFFCLFYVFIFIEHITEVCITLEYQYTYKREKENKHNL